VGLGHRLVRLTLRGTTLAGDSQLPTAGLLMRSISYPQRIVCLTEETTETLYLLGEEERIVGISGFTVRPLRARKEKPRVAAFTTAKLDSILDLEPDLVLGFSDLQANVARDLIAQGLTVMVFNQRSVQDILNMITLLSALVGASQRGEELVRKLTAHLEHIRTRASSLPQRPVVYFEEWDQPQISAIRWVSELIEIAGGKDCFAELARQPRAKDRIIADPMEVVRRAPDVIIGSWCGKKFRADKVRERPGWQDIPAVRHGRLFEIKSAHILQPGPAALTDGVDQLHRIIASWPGNSVATRLV
jgi:iron complex transport system substrate-binding protein